MLIYIILIILIIFLTMLKGDANDIYCREHLTVKNKNTSKKYKLAIMAIFKNEQDYMQEWLNHHINQGIDHFYLYCNDPNLNKYPYLKDNKYEKYITLISWVDKKNDGADTIQRQAYTHCVQTYNQEYHFIMMLDLDEFIIHTDKNKKVCDFIDSINNDWYRTRAIKVQRYDFGSNGHIKKPIGNLMDNYTKHEKICSSYKTIANSEYIDTKKKFYGVHDFYYLDKPGKVYNEYFSYKYTGFPNGCKKDSINEIPLVINHYYTKSYEEYLDRCKLWVNGGINTVGYRKDCEKTFKERDVNDVDLHQHH